jgi:hypothetical protein
VLGVLALLSMLACSVLFVLDDLGVHCDPWRAVALVAMLITGLPVICFNVAPGKPPWGAPGNPTRFEEEVRRTKRDR